MRALLVFTVVGLVGCGRSITYGKRGCDRLPSTTPQLVLLELNGHPRLWTTDFCIPVTYSPSLEPQKPLLQAALDAWDQVDCGGLCFEPPIPKGGKPVTDLDFRLHFEDVGSGGAGPWELLNDGNTGRALHATVFVNASSVEGEVLRQLGHVLGFDRTNLGRDSVLEDPRVPSPRTGLGEIDKQSVCAAYPACR